MQLFMNYLNILIFVKGVKSPSYNNYEFSQWQTDAVECCSVAPFIPVLYSDWSRVIDKDKIVSVG